MDSIPERFLTDRRQLRHSLHRYCEQHGITRKALAERLNAPYQTVAGWRNYGPSDHYIDLIKNEFPGIFESVFEARVEEASQALRGGLAKTEYGQDWTLRAHVRCRALTKDAQRAVKEKSVAVSRAFLLLDESASPFFQRPFLFKVAVDAWPKSPGEVRKLVNLPDAVCLLAAIKNVVERFGIPVVSAGAGDDLTTLVWVDSIGRFACRLPVIVYVGNFDPEAVARELGFALVGKDLAAAAKLSAVMEFADELLLPKAVIAPWLRGGQEYLIPRSEFVLLQKMLGSTSSLLERQLSRLNVRISTRVETEEEMRNCGFLAGLAKEWRHDPGAYH